MPQKVFLQNLETANLARNKIEDELEQDTFMCHNCMCNFISKSACLIHALNQRCRIGFKEEEEEEEEEPSKEAVTPEPKHKVKLVRFCDHCAFTTTIHNQLRAHMKVHRMRKVCHICLKEFNTTQSLQLHLTIHTIEKQFRCDKCYKAFGRKDKLLAHRKIHENIRVQCPECEKNFSSRKYLKVHIYEVHEEHPALLCDKCDYQTRSLCNLNKHRRIHDAGRKEHQCPLCDFITCERVYLKRHVQRMHVQQIYGELKCTICEQVLSSQKTLKSHMAAHSAGKRYQCDRCPDMFKGLDKLKIHTINVHTKCSDPCRKCGSVFETYAKLVYHRKMKCINRLS